LKNSKYYYNTNQTYLLKNRIKSRDLYSRRRLFIDDKDVDYINERNRAFNNKLNRYFEKDAAEIKANLERGTAL